MSDATNNEELRVWPHKAQAKGGTVKERKISDTEEILSECAWITIFSIFGVLTRLGLQSLNEYPGHIVPPLVWAQFVGCVVMGFMVKETRLFPKSSSKNDALYVGITTGYCGSVTSFSAWMLQVFQDLSNTAGYERSRGYNVITILTEVMVTLAAAFVAFFLGGHIAAFTDDILPLRRVPRISHIVLIVLLVLVAIGFQAATCLVAGLRQDWRGSVGFAMVFGPIGALTRWYLSRTLNRLLPTFPLGTFAANMIGTLLESIFHLLQYRVGSGNACSLLQGLQDGYCGTLTTISTFVVELCSLSKRHAYIYGLTSISIGLVLYVLVDGIDYWTHGSATGYYARCSF